MFTSLFDPEKAREAWDIFCTEFPLALWETVYATLLSTFFAVLIGLPLGILLVVGTPGGVLPLPRPLLKVLDVLINLLRSVPFLILMIVGTSIGTMASVVPLTVAAFPFVARLAEGSLREVDGNVVEAAESMGATPWQIIFRVMLPESVPSLVSNLTLALTTVLGYTAMSGAIGGGGLGKIAINYGYYRYKDLVMLMAVVLLILLEQGIQTLGGKLAIRLDKRRKS